nr:hypothetical protein B0A51_15533 [Rachicladosporium sp. CCFEE 5018]
MMDKSYLLLRTIAKSAPRQETSRYICTSCRHLSPQIENPRYPLRSVFRRQQSTAQPGDSPGFTSVLDNPPVLIRTNRKHNKFGLALLAAIPVISFGLGCWQVQRLEWKTEIMARFEDRLVREPLPLPPVVDPSAIKDFDYRRVYAKGVLRHEKEMLVGPRLHDGKDGFLVVTPLDRRGEFPDSEVNTTVLVNRGWIPASMADPRTRPEGLPIGVTTVEGLLREPWKRNLFTPVNKPEEGKFYFPDVAEMAAHAGAQGVWVEETMRNDLLESYRREEKGIPIGRAPEVNLRNNHGQYIFSQPGNKRHDVDGAKEAAKWNQQESQAEQGVVNSDQLLLVLFKFFKMSSKNQNHIVAGTSQGEGTINVQQLLDRPWYRIRHLRKLYLWMSVILIVQATNGLDGSIMNGVQSLPYWNAYFDYPTGARLALFNSTQGLGGVASQFFLWWLVEKIGRRLVIIIGSVIIILGVFLQSFAKGLVMFAVARAIIGLGLSFEYTAAPMLVTELAHPTHRAQLSTFLNTLYNLGATLAAWITLGTLTIQSDWSWRSVSLIQMLPSLISVTLTWFVPESPRWLVSRGRSEEALAILRTNHCGGDPSDTLAEFELREIQYTFDFEKEHSTGSWLDLFRTKGNRWRTWIVVTCSIAAQASGTTLTGYYLVVVLRLIGITDPRTQNIINGCLTMWNMGWSFWGASQIESLGRRPMMLTSLTGMLILGFMPWTICNAEYVIHDNAAAGKAVLAFIFIFTAFYSTTWNGILTGYTVECCSYDIRAKLICLQNLLVQGTITGFNYLNPVGLANIGWKYYIVVDCILVVEIVLVYFTYPETSKITLEEISVIFDGQRAAQPDLVKEATKGGVEVTHVETKHDVESERKEMSA